MLEHGGWCVWEGSGLGDGGGSVYILGNAVYIDVLSNPYLTCGFLFQFMDHPCLWFPVLLPFIQR